MPTPDLGGPGRSTGRLRMAQERANLKSVWNRLRRPPGRPDGEGEPAPVRPDRPLDLSGAAAALEFDE